jgi:hypothetical protein
VSSCTATGRFNRVGWPAGTGVEYAFLQNWSVRLEYDYLAFGRINETPTTTGGFGASSPLVKLDMQTVLPIDAFVEQDLHEAASTIRVLASSKKAMTCSRVTDGNPSRKSSIDSPASR